MDWRVWTQAATATVGTAATYLLGGWDTVLYTFAIVVALDVVTGILAAGKHGEVDSDKGARGWRRKAAYLVLVILAVSLDRLVQADAPIFRTLVLYGLIANDGISILENLGRMGVWVPPALRDALARLRDRED